MTDLEIIQHYGGATVLAKLMGLQTKGDAMRVQNWKTRGIPGKVKLKYPHIFLCKLTTKKA